MSIHAKKLRRAIMRRVYKAYALSLLTNAGFVHGMALGVSVGLFLQLVSLQNILRNLLQTELGSVPQFVFNAFLRGELLTIAVLGAIVFTALSFRWRLHAPRLKLTQAA